MPSVQKYMLIEKKHGAAFCSIREISDKLEKAKELVAVFFVETTGDMVPSGSVSRSPMTSASLYGSVSVWQSRCAVMLLRQP